MMRRGLLPLLLVALLAAPAGAQASAKSDQIINQCANESLSGSYSQKDYQQALNDLPADLKEYTDCADVIRTAQRNAATSGTGGAPRSVAGGGSGPTPGAPGVAGAAPPAATASGATPGAATASDAAPAGAAPAPATPAANPGAAADQAALDAAQAAGAGTVNIGGTSLTPGVPAGAALSLGDLPTPMLVLLGLFVLIALLGLGAMLKGWVLGLGRSRDAADPS